jgi:hypothetical protein
VAGPNRADVPEGYRSALGSVMVAAFVVGSLFGMLQFEDERLTVSH